MSNQFKISFSAWDIISCPCGIYHKKKKTHLPLMHPEIVKIREMYTRVAETGKLIQQRLRKIWIDEGVLLASENKIYNSWNLWCKFDAICKIDDQLLLYEIKGVSGDFFQRIKDTGRPRENNRTQLMIYHYFLREKYPGLKARLLYVNRKNLNDTHEIPIEYTDEEIGKIKEHTLALGESILNGQPLNPTQNVVLDPFTGQYIVNPTAIICDWHGICVSNDYWYPKALEEVERLNKKDE